MMELLILGLLLGAAAAYVGALVRFERGAKQRMAEVGATTAETDMTGMPAADLPPPVARFARQAGATGRAQAVELAQRAEMRMAPDKPWRTITARQAIAIRGPGFVWLAERRRGPFVVLRIVDAYVAGRGFLQARLLGAIPVADFSGPAADRSELMRYLAELAWAPDALLSNRALDWRTHADGAIEVSAESRGGRAAVRLYFNNDGDIYEIRADARDSTEGGKVIPRPWVGRFADYQMMGDRRIPTRAEVGYVYDDGYAAYWRGRITDYRIL